MDIKNRILQIAQTSSLPSEEELMKQLDEAISILENEDSSYRPRTAAGEAGGLVDFSSFQDKDAALPVILVPDLHGRRDFLCFLMDLKPFDADERTVETLLETGKIQVVCVGDGFHTETPGYCRERWEKAYEDYLEENYTGSSMREEMTDSLGVMLQVMELKKAFPKNFHFLKGNHENIMNEEGNGNHGFHKHVQEGAMTRDFVREYYSDAVVYLISLWEKRLPLVCLFDDFAVSHCEPESSWKRSQVINKDENQEVIYGLTWTANGEARKNSVQELFAELRGGSSSRTGVFWFGGHRPVLQKHCLRQQGHFLQFHNPLEMNVALVVPEKEFNPDKDLISIHGR